MDKSFIYIAGIILFMWLVFIGFIARYGEYVRNDPCSVCAKRMQGDITCSLTSAGGTVTRGYIRNGTIWDSQDITDGAGRGFEGIKKISINVSKGDS